MRTYLEMQLIIYLKVYYNEGNSNIDTARNIISALESRKEYLIRQINSISQDNYVQKIEQKIQSLKDEHENNMTKLRNDFKIKSEKIINNVSYEVEILNRNINDKKDQISILSDKKYELQNRKNSKEKLPFSSGVH